VVLKNDFALNSTDLRSYLKEKLPGYMTPSAFVFLNALPLTPHGKLDQRALPAPEQTRPELAESYQAPRNPVEESLASIWAEVLKLEKVGVDDNFFDLGGHSLKAVQVISRARKTFEVELPLRRLFETPTIVGLADAIGTLRWAKQNAAQGDDALTSEEETGEV
jgi:acyl carrier protein